MDERERRIREGISVILTDKSPAERRNFVRDMKAFLYTESRRIRDKEIEESLKGKQQVYRVY